jgi:hypothetical protein
MFMKKLLVIPALLVFMLIPFTASAHFIGNDSVDGGEIRWGTAKGTTGWTSARNHSISVWNGMGVIYIAGDTTSTVEDLSFKDVDRPDVTWSGSWLPQTGADVISYNDYFFFDFEPEQRMHTALHEMGHALGIDHHDLAGNVLRSGYWFYTQLGEHDKADYRTLWGY